MMSFLQNARIRTKILSLVIPLCICGVAGVGVVAKNYSDTDGEYSAFIANDAKAEINLAIASQRLVAVAYDAYQILTYPGDSPELASAKADYHASSKRYFELVTASKDLSPAQAQIFDEFEADAKRIFSITDKAVEAGSADQDDEAKAHLAQADREIAAALPKIRNWINGSSDQINVKAAALTTETQSTILYTVGVLSLVFAAGIAAVLFVTARGITGPIATLRARMVSLAGGETGEAIAGTDRRDEVGAMAAAVAVFRNNAIERIRLENEAVAHRTLSERERAEREAQKAQDAQDTEFAVKMLAGALQELSEGNVAYRITTPFVAQLDLLRENFNASVEKLETTLVQVGENARGIDGGANEIRAAADDLSKRTEQQAASVEETAAALEQITTTVKDSARRAEEAGALVGRARAGAERSGQVVSNAVGAMKSIETSSTEISNIIGVIDEIAFQTNLLALNAGVEAARAGEAGKGFAVVAQEVRELAQRSAQAAKEIKVLIRTSGDHVRAGVQFVGETGQSLSSIAEEVQEINRHVSAIVEAAREQAVGLQEINTAVNTMDQGTQQNAAMVEQSTAASHSLAKEAASLSALLGQFKMSSSTGGSATKLRSIARSMAAPSSNTSPTLGPRPRMKAVAGGSNNSADWQEF